MTEQEMHMIIGYLILTAVFLTWTGLLIYGSQALQVLF